ncbi:MAG: glycosyltransferase, partial [Phenylobacterium sp.]
MPSLAATRAFLVNLLVRAVWGVRAYALARPAAYAGLRAIGRPAVWLMHRLSGRASPQAPFDSRSEPVLRLPLDYPVETATPPPRIAVLLRADHPEGLAGLLDHLRRMPFPADLFVAIDREAARAAIAAALRGWPGGAAEVRVLARRGGDIAAYLAGFPEVFDNHAFVLVLPGRASTAAGLRSAALKSLLGSPEIVRGIFEAFTRLPELGIVAPPTAPARRRRLAWGADYAACRDIGDRLGLSLAPDSPLDFPTAGMFWARSAALRPLRDLGLTPEDLAGNASLARAVERLVFYACETAGLRWIHATAARGASRPQRLFRAETPLALRRCLTDQGRTLVLPGRPPQSSSAAGLRSDADRKQAFRTACLGDLEAFLASGQRLVLPTSGTPRVSVLVVLFNQAELTHQCLRALSRALDVACEVIIVDNASTDLTGALLDRVDGARIVRNGENLHFLRAMNQAAALARGEALLLLNNDTRVRPGSIGAGWARLVEEPDLGAVGGRIVLLDGTLQEAGSIIWRDGVCSGFGRGADPEAPEFQFRRDVDYCSGAFLMVRRALFDRLGGLDEAFAPAYYEETDLCMGIRQAGFRVGYEPRIKLSHFEFGSAASSAAALELQRQQQALFVERRRAALDADHCPPGAPELEARMRGRPIVSRPSGSIQL